MRRLWPLVLALALLAGAGGRDAIDIWVARTVLPSFRPTQSVEIIARDGSLLRAYPVADGRWRLEPGPVDPLFLSMLTAFEDRRFADHGGVDPMAMLRAAGQSVLAGRVVSGGSTLTMQVARLLEDSGTGRISGKLRQIRVALALERRLTKAQILDLYLRLAPYGGNVEGVRAASVLWFGKDPRRLTPAEAALLVALPQSPEARRPDRHPEAARAARDRVLGRMVAAGVIDEGQARAAMTEPVPKTRRAFPALAPQLADRLRREDPLATRIVTTIDPALQAGLERMAEERAAGSLSMAIVVADHRTGEILASVGAAAWGDTRPGGYLDMTRALRSPGSTLKPFVYGLAFDDGLLHPETLIDDRPAAFGTYAPQNFDRHFRGTLPVRAALQESLNLPVVALTERLGPERLLAALDRTGATTSLRGQPGLAVALGGLGISLHDLVQAYAALARQGSPVRLSERAGAAAPLPGRLFGPVAAWYVTDILAGLPPPATAMRDRIAYKTGTSYGHRDALAVGFDGGHVVGVWMGRPDGSPVPGAFGGDLAAPVLFETFGRIKSRADPLPPPPPAALILPNARLPPPLRNFRRSSDPVAVPDAPEVAFPPDGAVVETGALGLLAKVRDGTPPFTWLADGAPLAVAERRRETALAIRGPGFVTLSVIDARGRSARVSVTLR